jgi:tRNA pseudouridine55 synthase
MLTEKEKTYEACLLLGVETDTQDMTGRILKEEKVGCTEKQVEEVVESFLGDQMQVPPMYSALKVNGKKLYELAREGKEVQRKPRPVHFYQIKILSLDLPRVRLEVTCSKGTYIRTLCHDIGQKLGCGGAMETLVRTRVGQFSLEESHTLEEIREYVQGGTLGEILTSVEDMFSKYPVALCPESLERLLYNGNPLEVKALTETPVEGWLRVRDSKGVFIGIYEKKKESGLYYPVKMFYSQDAPGAAK